jgi:hypothetical protein
MLVNGAELKAPRIEACWAALKAEFASTLSATGLRLGGAQV